MISGAARQAFEDYISACQRDVVQYEHMLKENSYWGQRPLTEEERIEFHRIVALRKESISETQATLDRIRNDA